MNIKTNIFKGTILTITILLLGSCGSKSTKEVSETKTNQEKNITTIPSLQLLKSYSYDKAVSKLDYDGKEFIIKDLVVIESYDKNDVRNVSLSSYYPDDVFDGKNTGKPDGYGYRYLKIKDKMYRIYRGGRSLITLMLKNPRQIESGYQISGPRKVDISDPTTDFYGSVEVYDDVKIINVKGVVRMNDDGCFIEDGEIIE